MILRIQDRFGRGPWKPGFSHKWVSQDTTAPMLPPIQVEFPDFLSLVADAHERGQHLGVAVRGVQGLRAWFMPDELEALRGFGYRVVRCDQCRIIAESPHQVIIAHSRPLKRLPRVSWGEVLESAVAA